MVCKPDFWRFCAFRVPDMKNMEDVLKCMDSHIDQLAPQCAKIVANATKGLAEFHTACDPSLLELCPHDIGKATTGPCIAFNLDKLKPECLAELSAIMRKKAAMKSQGPGPPPPPHGGIDFVLSDSAQFFGDEEFGAEMLPSEASMAMGAKMGWFKGPEGPGMMRPGHNPFAAGFLGGAVACLLFAAVALCRRRLCRRHGCHFPHPPHPHPHPYPHPHPHPREGEVVGKPAEYRQFE